MIPILSPSQAASRTDGDFITAFIWRKSPILERIQSAIKENSCGQLRSLRFTWLRPARAAVSEAEFLYDVLAAIIDGAQVLADAPFAGLHITRVAGQNNLFALLGFTNGVVAEIEMNECLPDTMSDMCTLRANFTHGHVSNHPLVGHCNEEGMLLATADHLDANLIAESHLLEPARGSIEQMQLRFNTAARMTLDKDPVVQGPLNARAINSLIKGALS